MGWKRKTGLGGGGRRAKGRVSNAAPRNSKLGCKPAPLVGSLRSRLSFRVGVEQWLGGVVVLVAALVIQPLRFICSPSPK